MTIKRLVENHHLMRAIVPAVRRVAVAAQAGILLGILGGAGPSINQTISSIALSNNGTTTGLPAGTSVGTLSVTMSPIAPTFSYSGTNLRLSASGTDSGGVCNATNSAGNGSFQIINGDTLATNGTLSKQNYSICIAALEGDDPNGQTFTITVGTLINATDFCASNGGGDGSTGNPWQAACIQAAINAASNGDTVFLAAGNWQFDTSVSPVSTAKNITLLGAGSGNTFDALGHPNNGKGSAVGTVTRIYETGSSVPYPGTLPGGYLRFTGSGCGNITVAHIFFDGSGTINGGGIWGLFNVFDCANGNVTVDDIRFWSFGANNNTGGGLISGEAQFYVYATNNVTVTNSVMAEPPIISPQGDYPNSQILQTNWENALTVTNSVFYMLTQNAIYVDNVTFTGNATYLYNDETGQHAMIPSQGPAGCANDGCYNGSTTGNYHYYARNNLFYAPGNSIGLGGGLNETNGIVNDLQWSGNWILADQGYLDSCIWRWFGYCPDYVADSPGMHVNGLSFTNDSVISTDATSGVAAFNFQGTGCPYAGSHNVGTGPVCSGSSLNNMQCVNCSAQSNYFSSPNNQYLTSSNSISPSQSNNYCTGSSFFGCNTTGFTAAPTVSFTLGDLYHVNGTYFAPILSPTFTAQYGAVQWLASTSSTPPLATDARWSSNNSSFPNGGINTYVPPVSLSGVKHGNTVYLWVMDSASHIGTASAVIP
jgi:hypothetical protein